MGSGIRDPGGRSRCDVRGTIAAITPIRIPHFAFRIPNFGSRLIALADGEKHGYAIIKEVARRTDRGVTLSAGTLHTIIRRFVQEGVIAESDERPDPTLDDERRR